MDAEEGITRTVCFLHRGMEFGVSRGWVTVCDMGVGMRVGWGWGWDGGGGGVGVGVDQCT